MQVSNQMLTALVTYSNKRRENYHPNSVVFLICMASVRPLFSFSDPQLYSSVHYNQLQPQTQEAAVLIIL